LIKHIRLGVYFVKLSAVLILIDEAYKHTITIDMSTLLWAAAILDSASKVLPLVVAVSGRVGSDTPLICQQSGMRGVIVEETVSTDVLFFITLYFYCDE
jgi:hypothetical protein